MRLFTAIALPPEVSAVIADRIGHMRGLAQSAGLKLSWVPEAKLHITTKFIGEFSQDRLSELEAALAAIDRQGPIDIQMGPPCWMPNPRHPSALVTHIDSTGSLLSLVAATEAAVEPIGVPKEKRVYRPHLTLARTSGSRRAEQRSFFTALTSLEHASVSFQAPSFYLYLSDSGQYTKLREFPLTVR